MGTYVWAPPFCIWWILILIRTYFSVTKKNIPVPSAQNLLPKPKNCLTKVPYFRRFLSSIKLLIFSFQDPDLFFWMVNFGTPWEYFCCSMIWHSQHMVNHANDLCSILSRIVTFLIILAHCSSVVFSFTFDNPPPYTINFYASFCSFQMII